MGGKSGSNPEVNDFFLSLDFGVCHGPVDSFNEILVRDKTVWRGSMTDDAEVLYGRLRSLFGGDEGEGGVSGQIELYSGTDDQEQSDDLASRVDRASSTAPGYRGIAHIAFLGRDRQTGFLWSTNNPYMPAPKVSVSRMSVMDGVRIGNEAIYGYGTTPRAVFFAIDDSGSMEGDRAAVMREAMLLVLDRMDTAVQRQGLDIDVGISRWGTTSETIIRKGVSAGDIEALKSFVNGFYGGSGGTNFAAPASDAKDFFEDSLKRDIETRVMVFITDGEANTGSDDEAAEILSDVLDTDSGKLLGRQRTDVRCFGVNIVETDTSGTEKLVNTGQGVPVVSDDNPEAILQIVEQALFSDGHPSANPSYIIWECLTNPEWGKGEPPSNINLESFREAAATLSDERLGLSMLWSNSTDVKAFVQEVLDHIQAFLFVDPPTGLWTLKLLRGGYETDGLPWLTPENCVAKNRKRKGWGETVNEIVVTWTDPDSEKEATITAHNLANIAIQGGVISEGRNYYGVRNAQTAQMLANRDVEAAGQPLFSCEVEVDRTAWRAVPGALYKFAWPEDGIEEMIVRVMSVDYGSPRDRTITLSIAEDVFAAERTGYAPVQGAEGRTEAIVPRPLTHEFAMTPPPTLVFQSGASPEELDAEYPTVPVIVVGATTRQRITDFEMWGEAVKATGAVVTESLATIPKSRVKLLGVELPAEPSSSFPESLFEGLVPSGAEVGDRFILGDDPALQEIVMLDEYDDTLGTWSAIRGVYDTVPRPHALGTPVFPFPSARSYSTGLEHAVTEELSYRLLPRTREGTLEYEDAEDMTFVVDSRPFSPYRPANVSLDGVTFGEVNYIFGVKPDALPASWATRDRRAEDAIVRRWSDPSLDPEPGQTTTLQILDEAGTVVSKIEGIAATEYQVPMADLRLAGKGYVEFLAERDGFLSFQGHRIAFNVNDPSPVEISTARQLTVVQPLRDSAYVSTSRQLTVVQPLRDSTYVSAARQLVVLKSTTT